MSKQKWRSKETRILAEEAIALGFTVTVNSVGHLRCKDTAGRVVVLPSADKGRSMKMARSILRNKTHLCHCQQGAR